jgi:hypothetical protein
MRTFVSSFLLGVCLIAGPAMAQPWVAGSVGTEGCMYVGSLPNGRVCNHNGDASAQVYNSTRSGKQTGRRQAPILNDGSAH